MADQAQSTLRAVEIACSTARLRREDGLSDRDLLVRFARHGDQEAFATIVRRHAGMVFAVCRRHLPATQDAEDACQATFLVLSRKAATQRWDVSVANWLHTTARRVAANARQATQRRQRREGNATRPMPTELIDQVTTSELFTALDEELARLPIRYRGPLLLCYLEGLPRDEAAARLGVPLPTLKSQLERGRHKLADALRKRGFALGSPVFCLAAFPQAVTLAPNLIQNTIRALAEAPSERAASLAREFIVNGIVHRSFRAFLTLTAVVWLGIGAWSARPAASGSDQPQRANSVDAPPTKKQVSGKPAADAGQPVMGRVLDPNGKLVEGAIISLAQHDGREKISVRKLTTTDSEGSFRCVVPKWPSHEIGVRFLTATAPGFAGDWAVAHEPINKAVVFRLRKATIPIKGRLLTLEGKPVVGARVAIRVVTAPERGATAEETSRRSINIPSAIGLPQSVLTDSKGQFELRNIGDGCSTTLAYSGETVESTSVIVHLDRSYDPKSALKETGIRSPDSMRRRPTMPRYGPTFDHALRPTRLISGTVFDQKSKKPLPGVVVSGRATNDVGDNRVSTTTDAAGKFQLSGLPNARCMIYFGSPKPSPYLFLVKDVEPGEGLTPARIEMPLALGLVVTGQVTNRVTGKPVVGSVVYNPVTGNEYLKNLPGRDASTIGHLGHRLDAEGRYRIVTPPGPGILFFQAASFDGREQPYIQARIRSEDSKKPYLMRHESLGDVCLTASAHYHPLSSYHDYRLIDSEQGKEKLTVDVQLDPGASVKGSVVGPNGKPFSGATVAGLVETMETPSTLKTNEFEVHALTKDSRRVTAVDPKNKWSGSVSVKVGDANPPVLRLAPWGAVTGRVVNAQGKPLADVDIELEYSEVTVQRLRQHTGNTPVKSGADGKFSLDVPFTGIPFGLRLRQKKSALRLMNKASGDSVAPGKTHSFGDLVVALDD